MKKIIRNNIFGFILGIILCSGIVYGVNLYKSEDIQYQPSDESWEVSNVSDALNDLKDKFDNGNSKMELLWENPVLDQDTLVKTLKITADCNWEDYDKILVVGCSYRSCSLNYMHSQLYDLSEGANHPTAFFLSANGTSRAMSFLENKIEFSITSSQQSGNYGSYNVPYKIYGFNTNEVIIAP